MNRDPYIAQNSTGARPSDRQIEAFFRDPENSYADMRVPAILNAVGPFDSEVDWDFGCWVYEWRRRTIRIRVTTRSVYIDVIELQYENSPEVIAEVLWRHPR